MSVMVAASVCARHRPLLAQRWWRGLLSCGLVAVGLALANQAALAQPCVADCNADGRVTVDEVILGVRIALGEVPPDRCAWMDANTDGAVTVGDLLTAVTNLLAPWTTARVDVGGHKLAIRCAGEGAPVVALDAGRGGTIRDWRLVQPEVAGFTRVCAYNRAGNSGSDPGPLPRDAAQVVTELHALLANSCLAAKYVLVGHSLGGFHVRLFASEHPDEVAGLVTVDEAQEDLASRVRTEISADLAAALFDVPLDPLVPLVTREEHAAFDQSAEELRTSAPLPAVPFVLLFAGNDALPAPFESYKPAVDALSLEIEEHLAATVPNSRLRVIPDSGHYIQLDRPDAVIDAIRCVVNQVRGDACNPDAERPR